MDGVNNKVAQWCIQHGPPPMAGKQIAGLIACKRAILGFPDGEPCQECTRPFPRAWEESEIETKFVRKLCNGILIP